MMSTLLFSSIFVSSLQIFDLYPCRFCFFILPNYSLAHIQSFKTNNGQGNIFGFSDLNNRNSFFLLIQQFPTLLNLQSFPPCQSQSPLLTDFTPPLPHPLSNSGLKMVCNVNIVYRNLKSEY